MSELRFLRHRCIARPRFLSWLLGLCVLWLSPQLVADYPALRDSGDPELQQQLETLVKTRGLWELAENQRLHLALVDVSDLEEPRVAEINGNHMVYAASLPKVAILLSAFIEIERGRLELDQSLLDEMTAMIRHSSNSSATRVLEKVGRDNLLRILQSPELKLYDENYGGGLWVGKAYSKAGAYQRDPIHSISHGATAIQVARFYYYLVTGRLVNAEHSAMMLEILSKPAIKHKFVKGLGKRPGVLIYRKSGTWKQFHADGALVEYGDKRYIMVGLIEHKNGGRMLSELAPGLHDLVTEE